MPAKSSITLTELILLSLVWSATQFVWTNIIRESVTTMFAKFGLGKYATNAMSALFLLAAIMLMVLTFKNVSLGKSSVFMLTDDAPGIELPFGKQPESEDLPPGTFAPPPADPETFEPESFSLIRA